MTDLNYCANAEKLKVAPGSGGQSDEGLAEARSEES